MTRVSSPGELFGRAMREIRQDKGLTQAQLSRRSGLTQARISELESGVRMPNLLTVLRLAVALDCTAADLVAVFDGADLANLIK